MADEIWARSAKSLHCGDAAAASRRAVTAPRPPARRRSYPGSLGGAGAVQDLAQGFGRGFGPVPRTALFLRRDAGALLGDPRLPIRPRGPQFGAASQPSRRPASNAGRANAARLTIATGANRSQDGAHERAREYRGGLSRVRPASDRRPRNAGTPARSAALGELRRTALRKAALLALRQQRDPHRGRGGTNADRPGRDRPVPCMRLPHSPAAPGSIAGYECLPALCGRRGEAARPAAPPPAAGGHAKLSALRESDDRSPEQRRTGVLPELHVLSELPPDPALRRTCPDRSWRLKW